MKGCVSSSDKKKKKILLGPQYCMTSMHCVPEIIPITCHQVGSAPYKEWKAFSTFFPNAAQLIRYSFMGNYHAVSVSAGISEREPAGLQLALSTPFPIFRASISQVVLKLRSKDLLANSSTMRAEESLLPRGWWDCKECDTLIG